MPQLRFVIVQSVKSRLAEQAKHIFRFAVFGSLDEPSELPPKGEWFYSQHEDWMPVIPGKPAQAQFHKQ
ncbi:hypothetical protein P171DRAFT_526221 [Karstenula rhodostoma CBS 690.94]|uniref:Uncharacterized protein n=1 Tax=Karstenula rhodostoma CBS 690.94 TaxID=1392251 RepID=A0A9P4U5Y8_9PLEO|nr:hypothetical protein P171DRAFT_526221 [Karstenula rhodostoma CBS 690.94]